MNTGRFTFTETALSGLTKIESKPRGDSRGYLERLYCTDELESLMGDRRVVQINRSFSASKGTVRGMHYQRHPSAETKLVQCIRGSVLDVAIDVRPDSPTYLKWEGIELTEHNHVAFLIPEGFAHGFQTLRDDTEILYFHTAAYNQAAETGLNVLDPVLDITWPLPIKSLSDRDKKFAMLKNVRAEMKR